MPGYEKLEETADTDPVVEQKVETRVRGRTGANKRQSVLRSNNDGVYTEQQYMLLGILDAYTNGDVEDGEQERWLRRTPFLVLVYEGILQKHIDYDYAPAFIFFDQTFWQVNVSQQFSTDIDELILDLKVKAIKLSTKYHASGLAYQITQAGREMLRRGYPGNKEEDSDPLGYEEIEKKIDSFTQIEVKDKKGKIKLERYTVEFVSNEGFYRLAPQMVIEERVPDQVGDAEVGEDDQTACIVFHNENGEKYYQPVLSDITDTEDVSYVTSPWVPDVLIDNKDAFRGFEKANNADKALMCAGGQSNVKDELEELITLDNVHVLVCEWVPFGSNQIFALNDKLGSSEKMQGGLFLATVDQEPNRTTYRMDHDTGLTSVTVQDHQMDRFITFIADIQYEEDPGITQVEVFGVSCRDHGGCFYGMHMEAIQSNQADCISIDFMSRVLVDVIDDSSTLLDSLLSNYQRDLLDCVFNGKADKRSKYCIFVAQGFALPSMDDDKKDETVAGFLHLLDTNKEYENELKQVIGDINWSASFDEKRGIIIGAQGLLYLGDVQKVQDLLSFYGVVRAMNIFHQAFYRRIFTLNDYMSTLRNDIDNAFSDPNSGVNLRVQHANAVEVNIKLTQVREFLKEALDSVGIQLNKCTTEMETPENVDVARLKLWNALNLPMAVKDVTNRIVDMSKNIEAIQNALSQLYNGIDNIESMKMFSIQEAVNENTKNLEDQAKASERGSRALEIMQIILAGNLAFDIMDRYSEENPLDSENPVGWFFLSMAFFVLTAVVLIIYSRRAASAADKVLMLKFKLNKKVDPVKMRDWINSKDPDAEAYETFQTENDIRKVCWSEDDDAQWCTSGCEASVPDIVLLYDHKFGFLFQIYMTVMKVPNMMTDKQYLQCFLKQLLDSGVISPPTPQGVDAALIQLEKEAEEEETGNKPQDSSSDLDGIEMVELGAQPSRFGKSTD
mmetsp:Transcript_10575/g.20032  ORF Transcript_10575/g.20032 Transcript_10575/m.20032 type:complete len:956 (+) Transcript_10575:34-2901(+)|eukprot:CAMPEP_0175138220 /NCGR_PEP_ID=MMETSP0087-20121206/10226_1 /TAXON_ID=136419 /ORGANISM="Unknown Unknown, Strain D1" /LENGTH=955 /DNA_ID=CAMNT_0016421095 /DNA_START=34 /DNA_END=2901 /DNA_ORIENTATION=+